MQSLTISHTSDTGQRLDRFLKKYFPNAPLSAIYKMLRVGKIKVNGKKKAETYKIEEGDEISFWISDEELAWLREEMKKSKEASLIKSSHLPHASREVKSLSILYEDEYLMVVDKPAGMNVHPGDHKTEEVSLIELVQDTLAWRYDSLTFKPALVHRIDRDTSGCLLIAKEKSTLEELLRSLQSHEIDKIYHAVVSGSPKPEKGTFRDKLLRVENAKNEAKVRVDEGGWQSAVTHYQIIDSIDLWWAIGEHLSVLECHIETGRTHQIRVHLSFHNCPIIGDDAYGDKKINSFIRRHKGIDRQLLHAKKLIFIHPKTKKRLVVESPYPEDFLCIISKESQAQS